jgi:hypothetical protein
VKDAKTVFSKEEYAGGMVQRRSPKDAALKDVRTKLRKEECA